MNAELVVLGGPVFTGTRWARAIAVSGGRVAAVADDDRSARDWIGPDTRVVALQGRAAAPGFHDAHTHLLGGALAEAGLDVSAARSPAALAAAVAAHLAARRAARTDAGQSADAPPSEREGWVVGRGWDADLFPGRALPTRADLDAAAPDVPVVLRRRDGHAAVANGRALAAAGIDARTPDPPGGRVVRGPDGAPTGLLLEEPAIDLVEQRVPPLDAAGQERALRRAVARASAVGLTSVQDDPSFDERLQAADRYAALLERGELPLRVTLWRRLGRALEDLRAEAGDLEARGLPPDRVRFGQLKGYLDGSLGSRTALLFDPYRDDPGSRGVSLDPAGRLPAAVAAAHAWGFQVGLHAIGDRAVALALDAFAAAGPPEALRAARHRVEHAQLFAPADLPRIAALGAVASLQPIHLAADMRVAPERLGPERCALAFPFAALRDAGAPPLAFGSDFPVEVLDPLLGVACAVSHRSPREPDLPPLAPAQAISLEEALAAYTAGSAWAARQEDRLGRLAPGQLADLAVLDRDPRGLPFDELAQVRCLLTVLGGEVVYRDEAADLEG